MKTHAEDVTRMASITVVIAIALLLPSVSAGQMTATRVRELFPNQQPIPDRVTPGEGLLIIKSPIIDEPPIGISSPAIELISLSSERLALYPGAPIEFEIDGGGMMINGVSVVAGSPPQITPRPHLVALHVDPLSKSWELARAFALNNQNILEPIWRRAKSDPPDSRLYGKTFCTLA
jgi:hypothetical protein